VQLAQLAQLVQLVQLVLLVQPALQDHKALRETLTYKAIY